MHRLSYRNFGTYEALIATHTIAPTARIRWYEIRSPANNPTVYRQGTFAPDANYRWNQSIAMDGLGDIAIGYNMSSSLLHPGIYYTGRVVSDLPNTLQSENQVIVGEGSQVGGTHWGDYSSISVDPIFDCAFWQVGEYYNTITSPVNIFDWNTRIAHYAFPQCVGCFGDCNRDQQVTINEAITLVNIANGQSQRGGAPYTTCPQGDANEDGWITISDLVTAVNHILSGCPTAPASPPPTPGPLSAQFAISSFTGKPGDTKTFGVAVVNANGYTPTCAGLQLDLKFPANVISQPNCTINATTLPDFTLDTTSIAGGQMRTLIHSTEMGSISTFTVVPSGVVLYTCTAQVLISAPLGTYNLSGTFNYMSDPEGNPVTTIVAPGTITVNTTGGGCAMVTSTDDSAGSLALLIPVALLLTVRWRTRRSIAVALCGVTAAVLVLSGTGWTQDDVLDIEGELTITPAGCFVRWNWSFEHDGRVRSK